MIKLPKSVSRLKQEAATLGKEIAVPHTAALEIISQKYGFANWKAILKADEAFRALSQPIPKASVNFINDTDTTQDDLDLSISERSGDLDPETKIRLAKNKAYFGSIGVDYSIFEPTVTGLKKSILDATGPVRSHFVTEGFHSFDQQSQGDNHKVIKSAYFVSPYEINSSRVSLYRPLTKKGDPRMWFKGLGDFANPAEQIAIVIFNDALYLFNFSKFDIEALGTESNCTEFLSQYLISKNSIADELLQKLKQIAKAPIRATMVGDTAIGMAIENALGIPANSSKKPDYKGIELKGGRGKKTRSNLFAQVADWSISPLKSSSEILEKYGYQRGEDFKLYCTISSQKTNSQGLSFYYDESNDNLVEKDINGNVIAIWPGSLLRSRLLEKHNETFWIQATSIMIDGIEHFNLHTVTHTRQPLVSQLLPLIQAGVITMDHLIKRKGGSAAEKGPLFKINKSDLSFLFPEPKTYSLKS